MQQTCRMIPVRAATAGPGVFDAAARLAIVRPTECEPSPAAIVDAPQGVPPWPARRPPVWFRKGAIRETMRP